jgi:hypothetical protein
MNPAPPVTTTRAPCDERVREPADTTGDHGTVRPIHYPLVVALRSRVPATRRWRAGDTVVMRFLYDGRLRWSLPNVFVSSSDEHVVLYTSAGTRWIGPAGASEGEYVDQLANGWTVRSLVWHSTHVLRVTPWDAGHSVDLYWDAHDGRFLYWYVNFQSPLRMTQLGWDTSDHVIDIIVLPDRTWHMKDEADFARALDLQLWDGEHGRAVRAEVDGVIERVQAWAPPFCDGWEEWRPDPAWLPPALPSGWDSL